mgnify:CR=1 FL=1
MSIKEQVTEIISKKCNVKNINENDELTALGLDSLDLVESLLEIEDKLGIQFESNEMMELKTIKQVLDLIEKKKQQ